VRRWTLLAAFLVSLPASGLSSSNPSVLNSAEYFRLVESSAARITVRFEIAPGKDIPQDARAILAIPEPAYELRIVDYAYLDPTRERMPRGEAGAAEEGAQESALKKQCFKTETLWWHDLALEVITLRTRVSGLGDTPAANRSLCMLEFTLEFATPESPKTKDYAIARPGGPRGGYEEIFRRVVLNPDSVPEFRRRPEIALPEHSFCPEALGRPSASGRAIRVLVEGEGWYEIPYPQLKAVDAGVSNWQPQRVNLWSEGEPVPLEIEGLSDEGKWTDKTRLRFWGLASLSPESRARVYFLAEGNQPRHRLTPLPPADKASRAAARSVPYELTQAPERFIEEDTHAYVQGKWLWLKLTRDRPEVCEPVPDLAIDPQSATVSLTAVFHTDTQDTAQMELWVDEQHLAGSFTLPRRTRTVQSFELPSPWLLGQGHTLTWKTAEPLNHPDAGGVLLEKLTWQYARLLRPEPSGQWVFQRPAGGAPAQPGAAVPQDWEQERDLVLDATAPMQAFGRNASGTRLWDLRARVESVPAGSPGQDTRAGMPMPHEQLLRLAGAGLPPGCTHLILAEEGRGWPVAELQPVSPEFLHEATEAVDVLFISHRDFMEAMTPLVEHRRREGWRVRLVDVQAVYDEFSHGAYSAEAIRDFLTYTQARWPDPIPQYVVLVGDSTYDPKNNLESSVPSYLPYASYNRRVPTADPADEWFVRIHGSDGLSDLILGRISVRSVTDAHSVVQKILRFEERPLLGPWRCRTLLLSDNYFENRCEKLLKETVPPIFKREHLQVRQYPMFTHQAFKKQGKNKKMAPSANRELIALMNEGASLLEYFGHGGGCVIADEGWLIGADRHTSDVLKLDNRRRLPFVSILSCLTGLINYPLKPFNYSLSEELVRRPEQGAIAVYGPSGFGGAHDHEVLTQALNVNLYRDPVPRLGDATTLTEGLYTLLKDSSVINHQFNYFGDPLTHNSLPSTEARLECLPSIVNAMQGGRLRLVGQTPGLLEGRGLLRVALPGNGGVLQSIPVRLSEGRFEANLDWPPGSPTGDIQVQGYFWNTALGRDALTSASFRSLIPDVDLKPAGLHWDPAAGMIVLSATLENNTALPCADIGLTLVAQGRQVERRTLNLEPLDRRWVSFRLEPEPLEGEGRVELRVDYRSCAPLGAEPPEARPVCRFLLLWDPRVAQPPSAATPAVGLLALDLTALPERIYPGADSSRLPLRVMCVPWEELSELEVKLRAPILSSQKLAVPEAVPPAGQWWSFDLPAVVPREATQPFTLSLQRRWAAHPPKESTWTLEHPARGQLDLAINHLEVTDATPVEGYTLFLLAEVQNLGDALEQPAQLTLSTDQKGTSRNVLSNSFNIEAPSLPGRLRPGEIVRPLYRWEAFDNAGHHQLLAKVSGPEPSAERNPADNRCEVSLQVVPYGDYEEQLKQLRTSAAGLIPEKIQQTYRRAMGELEWYIGYENFDEHFAKPHRVRLLALLALGAEEFDLARRLVDKGMALKPDEPDNHYLRATMFFLEHRLEEGSAALRAALQGGFFDGDSVFAYQVRSDPRLVRAKRQAHSRDWQGNEMLLYSILEQQPANLWAFEVLGDLYRYHAFLERAAETYWQVLRLSGEDYSVLPAWWFRWAGLTCAELGQSQKALDIFTLGGKYHPQVDFTLWEAHPRVDLGQAQEVLRRLRAQVRKNLEVEERVFAWYEIGRCYEAEQHWQSAEAAFRASLKVDPLYRPSRRKLLKLRTQEQ